MVTCMNLETTETSGEPGVIKIPGWAWAIALATFATALTVSTATAGWLILGTIRGDIADENHSLRLSNVESSVIDNAAEIKAIRVQNEKVLDDLRFIKNAVTQDEN